MKLVSITLDPLGTYIGRSADGLLWYYVPRIAKWLLIDLEEMSNESEHRN